MENQKDNITAEVNENAYDTWLEPYIGWEFPVLRQTKNCVFFKMDIGNGRYRIESHNKELFNLKYS